MQGCWVMPAAQPLLEPWGAPLVLGGHCLLPQGVRTPTEMVLGGSSPAEHQSDVPTFSGKRCSRESPGLCLRMLPGRRAGTGGEPFTPAAAAGWSCASQPRVCVPWAPRLADASSPLSTDTSGENIAESLVAEGLASRREGIRANKYVWLWSRAAPVSPAHPPPRLFT